MHYFANFLVKCGKLNGKSYSSIFKYFLDFFYDFEIITFWLVFVLTLNVEKLSFPVINEKSNSRKYFASFVNSENSETRLKIYNTWMLIYLGIVTLDRKKKLWLETSADATIRIKSGKWNQTSWWVKSETDNKSAIIQVRIYFDFIQKLFWKTSVFCL